jgi:hypothetical protein
MERVYLLLRNNHQTGPFTIGELLQQQLQPSDMIWIEGKSTAWTYLSELELIPFVKNPEAAVQKNHPKTVDEIERKAEELRQKILTSTPQTYFPKYTTEIETYASPYKLPEDEIQFIDYRKERKIKKNAILGELLLTFLVIGLFIVGIYKGKSFLGARDKVQNSVATQLSSGDEHAAQKNIRVKQVIVPAPDTTQQHDSLLALQKVKPKPGITKKIADTSNTSLSQSVSKATNQEVKKEETIIQSTLQNPEENSIKKEEPLKKEIIPVVPEIKTNKEPGKEEKKGFLRGLFKKKKREENSTGKKE